MLYLPNYFEQLATDHIGHIADKQERFAMLEYDEATIRIREQLDPGEFIMLLGLPGSQLADAYSDNPHDYQAVELYIQQRVDHGDHKAIRRAVYDIAKTKLLEIVGRIRKDRSEYIIHGFDLNNTELEPVFGLPDPNYFGHKAIFTVHQSIASALYAGQQ